MYLKINKIKFRLLLKKLFLNGRNQKKKRFRFLPREKDFFSQKLNKEMVKKKVRNTLFKYPIIPYLFYVVAI